MPNKGLSLVFPFFFNERFTKAKFTLRIKDILRGRHLQSYTGSEKHKPLFDLFNLLDCTLGLTRWRRQEGIRLLGCLSGLRTMPFDLIL